MSSLTKGQAHSPGFAYHLYGLSITSQWPLPFPEAGGLTDPPEIELVQGSASFFSQARSEAGAAPRDTDWPRHYCLKDGSIYLRWPALFEFLISSSGRRISGRPLGETSWEAFQTYLLGQVLSYALIKSGVEPLHCTVVVTEGKAVGLLGDCGCGKSSLAAAFIQQGCRLLTDDLLILKENRQGYLAFPSFPRIKLFPEIAGALLGDHSSGTPMNPFTRKLIIPLGLEQSCQTPRPLIAFFVLRPPRSRSRGNRVTIRTLPKRRACLDLIANTFNAQVTDPHRQRRLLTWTAGLANSLPLQSLSYPRNLARLPQVVAAVLARLRSII